MATLAHFRRLGLDMVPGTGLLAACVPGMFDTWMLLLRDYGSLPLAEVLAPAIFYAGEGHPLVERAHATIATVAPSNARHARSAVSTVTTRATDTALRSILPWTTISTTATRLSATSQSG